MKHLITLIFLLFIAFTPALAATGKTEAQATSKDAISMDALLEQVKRGKQLDAAENRTRIEEFNRNQTQQKTMLAALKKEEKEQEKISESREQTFENNDQEIILLEQRLTERLGSLKELFGVLQQVSSDAQASFYHSPTQLQFPGRIDYLSEFSNKMGTTSDLPSIAEIEQLWFELQREMVETGKVHRMPYAVVNRSGEKKQQEVIRVGAFNLVSEGQYLRYIPETGRVIEYARQPAPRFLDGAQAITDQTNTTVPFTIDPTRGQLLSLLIAVPGLVERVAQGGTIGYLIIALGIISVTLALIRLAILWLTQRRVNAQKRTPNESHNNPLGRILAEYNSHKERDIETLELKLSEAVLREVPKITRGLGLLKIIAAIAPLMGLLGTVTGMIITFQSIVLFGAGDPKMMAGGISQALVTTVLGLSVAIPTLLLHNFVQTRARAISETLEQEAVAIVADQAEAQHREV